MSSLLYLLISVVSVLIVLFVLLQGRGAGLGSAWGGGGEMFQTRRGIEKVTMQVTVVFIAIFFILSLVLLFT